MRVSVFVSSSARLHHGLYIALGIEEICKNAQSNSLNRYESSGKKSEERGILLLISEIPRPLLFRYQLAPGSRRV